MFAGEAVNGHEAVRAAPLLCPDLIVLELAMPVMNGLVLLCYKLNTFC